MTTPVPALVTLHLWRVAPRGVPSALARMGADRVRVRRTPGVRFAKLLGTGDGRTFTARDADPTRWGLLTCWSDAALAARFEGSRVVRGWAGLAEESWRVDLAPISSHGRWSGREPFGAPTPVKTGGPVAAVTRARLSVRGARSFWRAVPPVSAELGRSPGLLAAVGVGEAPVGLQGTFSLWRSGRDLTEFAHRTPAHTAAVARTGPEGWYAEELFARFAVVGSAGTLDGSDPLA